MKYTFRLLTLALLLSVVVCSCEFHDDSPAAEPDEYATIENIVGATYSCENLTITFISESVAECTLSLYDDIPMVSGEYSFLSDDDKTADFDFDYLWEENMDEPTQVLRYRVLIDGEFASKEKLFVKELYYSYRRGLSISESFTINNLSLYRQ